MKKEISPPVAAIVIIVAAVAVGLLVYMRAGNGTQQYGAKMPDWS